MSDAPVTREHREAALNASRASFTVRGMPPSDFIDRGETPYVVLRAIAQAIANAEARGRAAERERILGLAAELTNELSEYSESPENLGTVHEMRLIGGVRALHRLVMWIGDETKGGE